MLSIMGKYPVRWILIIKKYPVSAINNGEEVFS